MSHPFQRAKKLNLTILARLWEGINQNEEYDEEDKKLILKRNFIKNTGCSFRKLKEYCDDIGLEISW